MNMEQDLQVRASDVDRHMVVMGATGTGRCEILEQIAEMRGITVEELLASEKPSPEALSEREQRKNAARAKDQARSKAVREAYWDNTENKRSEFGNLYDCVLEAAGYTSFELVTESKVKALLLALPNSIVGQGITWGFGDSVVRDDLHEFCRDNKQIVLQAIALCE